MIAGLKESIQKLLKEVMKILNNRNFNIEKNFDFKRKRYKDDPLDPCNNNNTLLSLDYDTWDVIEEIKSLQIENFYKLQVDDKCDKKKPFYCFIKIIKGRHVYIKLKIKEGDNNNVLCVSFHFEKYKVDIKSLPFSK